MKMKKKKKDSLNFFEANRMAASQIFKFSGRSRRSEYAFYCLSVTLSMNIISEVLAILFNSTKEDTAVFFFTVGLGLLLVIITSFATLSCTVRRLHDIGKSGWWILWIGICQICWVACSTYLVSLNPERMPDFSNLSGLCWWGVVCISWIPMIAFGLLLCFKDGKDVENKYGLSPKYYYESNTENKQDNIYQ